MVAVAVIGAGVLGAGATMVGASKAANAQKNAANAANATELAMFNRQVELQEPFRQGGLTAQQQIMQLLGIGGDPNAAGYGSLGKAFSMSDFEADPGYQFRMDEAQRALDHSASARGMLLSGSTLKGIERYSQGLASQEYQNAFNRYQIERAAKLNPLQSLMGSGQSSANTLTNAAANYGNASAANTMAAGQARASGYVGMGNAISNALSGAANTYAAIPMYNAQANYLNSLANAPYNAASANAMAGVNNIISSSPYTAANYGAAGF